MKAEHMVLAQVCFQWGHHMSTVQTGDKGAHYTVTLLSLFAPKMMIRCK